MRRRRPPASLPRTLAGILLFGAVATALLTAIAGGLARVGLVALALAQADWLGHAALAHAALMMGGFMGTVIGVERAVAVRHGAAWLAPAASAAAALCLLAGAHEAGRWLLLAGSVFFCAVNALVLRRQPAGHTALLLAGALAWAVGNLLQVLQPGAGAALAWWFLFLVLTIAAERLEMTRLMRRRPGALLLLWAVLAALWAGAAWSVVAPRAGGVLFGAALCALAAWLLCFDIARRTVLARGLPRYMAVCLLAGYAWLGVGGLAWAATALGVPVRDAALHALGLGFIFSMMLGHAPVILPAVARVKLLFGGFFYLPLVVLQGSLAVRVFAGAGDVAWRAQGALANALAIALFAGTAVGAAWAWRRRERKQGVSCAAGAPTPTLPQRGRE